MAVALVTGLFGCQQSDQELPFELEGGGQQTIGASGGTVSLPPSFSIEFPPGALAQSTQINVEVLTTAFPSGAGVVVPSTSYLVSSNPPGAQLLAPATVQIGVAEDLLQVGEAVRLSLAFQRQTGELVTDAQTYDIANGILSAEIDELGPVAAVVNLDAIPVEDLASIPPLGGGSIAPPPAPQPAGPARQGPGTVTFTASCSTAERQCFSSGIIQIWVDDRVRDRLGDDIVLAQATVDAYFEFLDFVGNTPTSAEASLTIVGELRAILNSVVSGREVGDDISFFTGNGVSPSPTAVTFNMNQLLLAQTSEDDPELLDYAVAGIGTGEQLTIRFVGSIDFDDGDPPGEIVAHIRLRR